MSSVLIIGASRGIGAEFARRYAIAGWEVHATRRQEGSWVDKLEGNVHLHLLDVLKDFDAWTLLHKLPPIDLLIHNAGVGLDANRDKMFAVNTYAPMRMLSIFLPLVKDKIVIISSRAGSSQAPRYLGDYSDSKRELNNLFRETEPVWREQGITSIVMHPGWVRTDMTEINAPLSVEESVDAMINFIPKLQ